MANQLLATFYVEFSQEPVQTVWATVQMPPNVYGLTVPAAEAVAGNPLRYKIDVEREENQYYDDAKGEYVGYYPFFKAGAYECKLVVNFGGALPLERFLFITIQPDVHVYREVSGSQVDLITTTRSNTGQNPANDTVTVNVSNTAPALAARAIRLNESPDGYKGSVLVKSNLPIDLEGSDLLAESSSNTWLQFADTIRMTRKIGDADYQWTGDDSVLVDDTTGYYSYGYYYTGLLNNEAVKQRQPIMLGLEKMPLALPLLFESGFLLCGRGVEKYTGSGNATTLTQKINVSFTVTLKTPHQVKISPNILTLDEDNNFTSFVAVEANDDAPWTLAPVDSRITATPSNGMGRVAVVIKATNPSNQSNPFVNVSLKATSTVDASTKTHSSAVHLEQYTPEKNALIPKQSIAGREMFNNSLTDFGKAVGDWATELRQGSNWETIPEQEALGNLENFPKIEFSFGTKVFHRVRSWSLQSVGEYYGSLDDKQWSKRVATKLLLQGWTNDNKWEILDIVDLSSGFYSSTKPRVDKTVHHREVVSKIRVVVIDAINENWHYDENWNQVQEDNSVYLPQIQVFAGEPVMPKMSSSQNGWDSTKNQYTITIEASSGTEGYKVFDRAVSGGTAPVGPAAWYLNFGNTIRNHVANRGAQCRLSDFSSVCWLAVTFPKSHLIGYLYSIDKVSDSAENFAKLPYAASLYFEGKETADLNAIEQTSEEGEWSNLGLISLDKCIGFNQQSSSTASSLLDGSQTDLNAWANSVLGLSGNNRDKAFLVNEVGEPNWSILQFNLPANAWQNKGKDFTLAMDAITDTENRTHYADFTTITALEQLRFVVQSVMNFMRLPIGLQQVLMPEMQFFGLPSEEDTINKGAVATVSYFKAEDEHGNLHDILGRHQWVPFLSPYSTSVRIYWGEFSNIADNYGTKTLYFNGTGYTFYDNDSYIEIYAPSDSRTALRDYELYVYSANGEKIILSSGFLGEQP